MTPKEYKELKTRLSEAELSVTAAKERVEEAEEVLRDARRKEYLLQQEVQKWQPLTPAQKKALLAIYLAGGVMKSGQGFWVDLTKEKILPVVADGLKSRSCFGKGVRSGSWVLAYTLSEHGIALAKQIEQEELSK